MAKICKTLTTYREMIKGAGISDIEETTSKEKILGIVQLFESVNDVICSGSERESFQPFGRSRRLFYGGRTVKSAKSKDKKSPFLRG